MCPLAFPLIGGTYGDAKSASNLLADKGELAVEVSSAQPREILVTPNLFVDCRFKGDSREGRSMGYSVDEIASKGSDREPVRPESCSAKPGRSCSVRSLEIGGGTIEIVAALVDSDWCCAVIYVSRCLSAHSQGLKPYGGWARPAVRWEAVRLW
jgi:hypothetical protein